MTASAAALALRIGGVVESDMLALAGDSFGPEMRIVAEASASRARVIVEGTNRSDVACGANIVRDVFRVGGKAGGGSQLDGVRGNADGLLDPETRSLLLSNEVAAVRESAEARLFGLAPPLFPVKDDPMLLASMFVESLSGFLAPGWSFRDGLPMKSDGAVECALVSLSLNGRSPHEIAAAMDRLPRELPRGVAVHFSGSAFHSARSASRAEREIGFLSLASLVLVLLLGWRLFRSFDFVLPLAAALFVGALAATGALFAVWPRPHVLTFVFGTSLIGLSVDYVYHVRAASGAKAVLKPLTQSFATTFVCFAPLLFADLPVLRQMALFTMTGLAAVYAFVVTFEPIAKPQVHSAGRTPRRIATAWRAPRGLRLALLLVASCGMFFVKSTSDPSAFYRPDPSLAADEKIVADRLVMRRARMVFTRGATLQEALEREESANVPSGLSRIVPSLRRQRENAALIARLYGAEGAAYAAHTGLKAPKAPEKPNLLDPADCPPDSPLGMAVAAMWTGRGLMSPCPDDFTADDPDVLVIDMRSAVEGVFDSATDSTLRLFVFSFLAISVFLAIVFRRRFIAFAFPVLATFAATSGAMGWLGVPFTFFTLLSFFVLMGLGLDYTIFHRGTNAASSRRTVFFAFLTSLAGLGLLSFTAFPVTRDMGITFALGLFFAYAFSFPGGNRHVAEDRSPAASSGDRWFAQKEQSAGRLRLNIMWFAYTILGKGFLKALCVPVMVFIYPFARPARAALREYYSVLAAFCRRFQRLPPPHPTYWTLFRHLLGFALSLADKTDACSLKKSLPRMTVRDDDGFHAFRDCIASGKGAFIIASHVGTAEVLPALPRMRTDLPRVPHVHAFQQMAYDEVFTEVFMRRFDASSLTLHAVEDIGVETAVEMQSAIGRGEIVIMSGDRVSAGSTKTLGHSFLGVDCAWPKGVFAFARLMEAPVFFATCVRTGWNAYEAHFAAAPEASESGRLLDAYISFLEFEVLAHPLEWHQFYRFFPPPSR